MITCKCQCRVPSNSHLSSQSKCLLTKQPHLLSYIRCGDDWVTMFTYYLVLSTLTFWLWRDSLLNTVRYIHRTSSNPSPHSTMIHHHSCCHTWCVCEQVVLFSCISCKGFIKSQIVAVTFSLHLLISSFQANIRIVLSCDWSKTRLTVVYRVIQTN